MTTLTFPKISADVVSALSDVADAYALFAPENTGYPFIVFSETNRVIDMRSKDDYVCSITLDVKWVGKNRADGIDALDDIMQALLGLEDSITDYTVEAVSIVSSNEAHDNGEIVIESVVCELIIS